MPKVWLVEYDYGYAVETTENVDGVPVEMNASLLRQIVAAEKKHNMFQHKLSQWYNDVKAHKRGRIGSEHGV